MGVFLIFSLLAMGVWASAVIATDLRHRRISNASVLVGLLLVGVLAIGFGGRSAWIGLGGFAWWLVGVGVPWILPAARAGGGDAKLGLVLGSACLAVGPLALWVAIGCSGLLQAAGMALARTSRTVVESDKATGLGTPGSVERSWPHAPAMFAGAFLGCLVGWMVGELG